MDQLAVIETPSAVTAMRLVAAEPRAYLRYVDIRAGGNPKR